MLYTMIAEVNDANGHPLNTYIEQMESDTVAASLEKWVEVSRLKPQLSKITISIITDAEPISGLSNCWRSAGSEDNGRQFIITIVKTNSDR